MPLSDKEIVDLMDYHHKGQLVPGVQKGDMGRHHPAQL